MLVEMNDGSTNGPGGTPSYVVKYTYDGMGRRLLEGVTSGGNTVTKRNLWCGGTLCQLRDTSTVRLKRYLATGEYDYSVSKKYLYRQDHLGSVRDLVDASTGLAVGSQDFDPYGRSRNASGIQSDYRYAGLLWAQPIGLYFSATRAYDPGTTRWMTRDWIREAGGANMYGYGAASPSNYTDPSGTCIPPTTLLCFAAAAAEVTGTAVAGAEIAAAGASAAAAGAATTAAAARALSTLRSSISSIRGIVNAARIARNAENGKKAEDAVRRMCQIGDKGPIRVDGQIRYPDGRIVGQEINEVKSGAYQAMTPQFRAFIRWAEDTGEKFNFITTNPNIRMSGPVQEAIEAGKITHIPVEITP